MLNAKSSENFLSPDQNWANFGGFGGLGVRGFKKLRFLPQRHVLAWTHVVWAIFRQNRSRGVTSRSVQEKTEKVTDSHRKDMSPLTQGLNDRSACDRTAELILYTVPAMALFSDELLCVTQSIYWNKKDVISQRWPRNSPYIWVPWNFLGIPDYAHGYFSQNFMGFCSDGTVRMSVGEFL